MYIVIFQYTIGGMATRLCVYENRDAFKKDRELKSLLDENKIFIKSEIPEVDEIINKTGNVLPINHSN